MNGCHARMRPMRVRTRTTSHVGRLPSTVRSNKNLTRSLEGLPSSKLNKEITSSDWFMSPSGGPWESMGIPLICGGSLWLEFVVGGNVPHMFIGHARSADRGRRPHTAATDGHSACAGRPQQWHDRSIGTVCLVTRLIRDVGRREWLGLRSESKVIVDGDEPGPALDRGPCTYHRALTVSTASSTTAQYPYTTPDGRRDA